MCCFLMIQGKPSWISGVVELFPYGVVSYIMFVYFHPVTWGCIDKTHCGSILV